MIEVRLKASQIVSEVLPGATVEDGSEKKFAIVYAGLRIAEADFVNEAWLNALEVIRYPFQAHDDVCLVSKVAKESVS